jgi:hypothetical protein
MTLEDARAKAQAVANRDRKVLALRAGFPAIDPAKSRTVLLPRVSALG